MWCLGWWFDLDSLRLKAAYVKLVIIIMLVIKRMSKIIIRIIVLIILWAGR